MDATRPIVAREEELARIDAVLGRPVEGLPAAVFLEGEAGVGKTTLWRAAVDRAERLGYRVLSSALSAGESRLAFAGIADLVADPLVEAGDELSSPQREALEEALLLRAGSRALPDERAVAFAVLGVLRALGRERRVAIAVDDLQWLDPSSLAALSFASRRLRDEHVVLVCAVRLEAGRDPDLLHLRDAQRLTVEHVRVGSLTLGALHRVLRNELGEALPRPELVRIHAASAGNPLHALELVRARRAPEHERATSLHELLRRRVSALPAPTRRGLLLASLSATPTVPTLVSAGLGDARARLGGANADDLVALDGDAIRFRHPLVAAAVVDLADEDEVREAHRALAATTTSEEDRARHLAGSADGPDETVALALDRAAAQAERRGARATSAELWEEAATQTPVDDVRARGRRMVGAGRAQYEAGDATRAQELLAAAIDALPHCDERSEALWRLGAVLDETNDWEQADRLWRDALAATDDPRVLAEVHRRMAYAALFTGSVEAGREHARLGLEAAERVADPELVAYALGAAAYASVMAGMDGYEPLLDRALALERDLHVTGEWSPSAVAAECRRLRGHARASLAPYAAVMDAAIADGNAALELWAAFGLAASRLLVGDLDGAAELARSAHELAEQTNVMQIPAATLLAHVHAQAGELDLARQAARTSLARAREAGERLHAFNALFVLALAEASEGHGEAAARLYGEANRLALALGARHATALRSFLLETETAAEVDLPAAEAALAAYVSAASGREPVWLGCLERRARAAVATARGDLGRAAELLAAATAEPDPEVPFEAARNRLAHGRLLRRTRAYARAREELEAARTTLEALGAATWAGRAAEELLRLPGRRAPDGDELTAGERRIADLVAQGLPNKEVAAALHVSVKTVELSLTRVYRKLGVRSRAALARHVAEKPIS